MGDGRSYFGHIMETAVELVNLDILEQENQR